MYFNYHAKIKRLIKEGHCVGYEFVEGYHKISPCLLIYCDDGKIYPIREHKFEEYQFLLLTHGINKKSDEKDIFPLK